METNMPSFHWKTKPIKINQWTLTCLSLSFQPNRESGLSHSDPSCQGQWTITWIVKLSCLSIVLSILSMNSWPHQPGRVSFSSFLHSFHTLPGKCQAVIGTIINLNNSSLFPKNSFLDVVELGDWDILLATQKQINDCFQGSVGLLKPNVEPKYGVQPHCSSMHVSETYSPSITNSCDKISSV